MIVEIDFKFQINSKVKPKNSKMGQPYFITDRKTIGNIKAYFVSDANGVTIGEYEEKELLHFTI